jgi:phospholipid/cholesterol/gamma-HCH transport system ATP-binding protein
MSAISIVTSATSSAANAQPRGLVEVRGVTRSFGGQPVLRGVDLVVQPGTIATVIGGSGTGKSVLLKHVLALLRPDSGEVRIDGESITDATGRELVRLRRKFGVMFQGAALFDSMTVEQNVAFPLREHTKLSSRDIAAQVSSRLEELSLLPAARRYPSEISGGMRKRVALARALALEPEIVLYDEPTSGLDPILAEQVHELIWRTHRARQMTALVVSHDLPAAFRYSDVIVLLHEGRVALAGSPAEVLAAPHPYLARLLDAAGMAAGAAPLGATPRH